MPYLPTEPLLPYLRAVIDTEVMRQGRPDSGVYGLCFEMERISGVKVESARMQVYKVLHGKIHVIQDRTADLFASALGMHPRDIWPDYDEITNASVSGWSCRRASGVGHVSAARFRYVPRALRWLRRLRPAAREVLRPQPGRQALWEGAAARPARVRDARRQGAGGGGGRRAKDRARAR